MFVLIINSGYLHIFEFWILISKIVNCFESYDEREKWNVNILTKQM